MGRLWPEGVDFGGAVLDGDVAVNDLGSNFPEGVVHVATNEVRGVEAEHVGILENLNEVRLQWMPQRWVSAGVRGYETGEDEVLAVTLLQCLLRFLASVGVLRASEILHDGPNLWTIVEGTNEGAATEDRTIGAVAWEEEHVNCAFAAIGNRGAFWEEGRDCLLYTSDAADE